MSSTTRLSASPAAPSRRLAPTSALGVGVGLLGAGSLAGCTSGSTPGPTPPVPSPDADAKARRAAADLERRLATQATLLAPSAAATALGARFVTTVRASAAAHTAHAQALDPSGTQAPSPSASSTAPTPSGYLAAQTAAVTTQQALVAGVSGDLARLIASVAASNAAFGSRLRATGAR